MRKFNPSDGMVQTGFDANLDKYVQFVSWCRWNPDLWYDLITPEKGGIRLDLDQRVFLRAMSRFVSMYGVFPRGYGKCVSGDTYLYTDEGVKTIGEYFSNIQGKKEIYTGHKISLLNRNGELETTRAGVYSGYLPTKKITTEEGYEIEGTYNHPILAIDHIGEIVFKQLDELSEGDYVVINRRNDLWGNVEVTADLNDILNDSVENGIISDTIMNAPKNIVVQFIKKIFNSDQAVKGFKNLPEVFSKQLQLLLLNLGIVSVRKCTDKKDRLYSIKIYKKDNVGLAEKLLQNNPDQKILIENYYFGRISDIKDGKNHVYDLSLPETQSFVSNGFVSHNTFLEILGMYHTAIFYPNIDLSLTAQTRENAAALLREKHSEIERFYPLIKKELDGEPRFAKDTAEIKFLSGGRIDVLANRQESKGRRRKRINIEESNLLNNELFEDVLEPIVNIPRRTIGEKSLVNPEEMNGQINFFTTSGFRGSSEFERNLKMVQSMANLEGQIVLGSDWRLAANYNRGEPKSLILDRKERVSPVFFAMNYESKWVNFAPSYSNVCRKLSEPVHTGCAA